MSDFQAIVVRNAEEGTRASLEMRSRDELPPGDVLVAVEYSSLNYKDALAVTGRARVIRQFPMVAGVDLAGEVLESATDAFFPGEKIVATGAGLGEIHWGGFAELARIPADWATRLPPGMSTEQAMRLGTAGFTAMLSILALEDHGLSHDEEVVVTGAGGGVGGLSVALLAAQGRRPIAVTGRPEEEAYFRQLGAAGVLPREEIEKAADRPLAKARFSAAIDTVGGRMLAGLLASLEEGGVVAACGMAGGAELPATVYPFIIRGATLIGIDSVRCPPERRRLAWERLSRETPWERIDPMFQTISLSRVLDASGRLLAGEIRGRLVVKVGR
jgi:acrylyl-CoA reductase (NADPH)